MKSRNIWILALALVATFSLALTPVFSAGTIVVTPTNQQGWTTADTRPGGAVNFVADPSAPAGNGALQLTTDATTAAKAQYMHEANTPIGDVTELSYWTRQISAPFPGADASYQLPVCLEGFTSPQTPANPTGCTGFTTFVFEPYQNGVVVPNIWQQWDVDAGQFWSSRNYVGSGTCAVAAGAGGAPFYSLATVQTICPSAVVVGFGVNIGTFNPSYNVYTDLVNFNGTTYDFEPYQVATAAGQCKNGGFANVRRADGSPFKNQGDCMQYVNAGK